MRAVIVILQMALITALVVAVGVVFYAVARVSLVVASCFPDVVERHHAAYADELLFVHPRDGGPDRRRQRLRVAGFGPDDEKDVVRKVLRHRYIELDERRGLIGPSLHLPRDADDLAHDRRGLRSRSVRG